MYSFQIEKFMVHVSRTRTNEYYFVISSFYTFSADCPGLGCGSSSLSIGVKTSPSQPPPPVLLGGWLSVPKPAKLQNLSRVSWFCSRVSSQLDIPEAPRKGPGVILVRGLNHLTDSFRCGAAAQLNDRCPHPIYG